MIVIKRGDCELTIENESALVKKLSEHFRIPESEITEKHICRIFVDALSNAIDNDAATAKTNE